MNRVQRPEVERSLLCVIDVQDRLVPAMQDDLRTNLLANLVRWGEASKTLGLPVLITEQYPTGLGSTVAPVASAFADLSPLPKMTFDALEDAKIAERVTTLAPETVIVAGMETHICVFQTVRTLVARGYRTLVLADACASRSRENYSVGLDLCRAAGAIVTTTETTLFDLVGRAGTDTFRAISRLVR